MTNCAIKIIIADDHPLVRKGLVDFINDQPGMRVVAEALNGRQLLQFAATVEADVVITDIEMPVMNGLDAIRQITREYTHLACIAISFCDMPKYILRIIEAGAKGYIIKGSHPCQIIEAIHNLGKGGIFYCEETRPIMKKYEQEMQANGKDTTKLTEKEEQILQLTCEDLTVKEIAAKVKLTENTVNSYSKIIKQKTGTKSISGMAVYAIKHFIYLLKR